MATTAQEQHMYSVADLAEVWGLSASTVYKWVDKGDFPTYLKLPNGEIRVLADDLDVWTLSRRRAA